MLYFCKQWLNIWKAFDILFISNVAVCQNKLFWAWALNEAIELVA